MLQPFSCLSCAPPIISATPVEDPLFLSQELDLTFSRIRRSLEAALPSQTVSEMLPLSVWKPEVGLSLLLPDLWAYVGDLLRLYGAWSRAESLIATARQRRAIRKLALLIGHLQMPAIGLQGHVAALIAGTESPSLKGASIRAQSPTSSILYFEVCSEQRARRTSNEFLIAPQRRRFAATLGKRSVLLDISTASAVRGAPVLFVWPEKIVRRKATEIVDVKLKNASDTQSYLEMEVFDPPTWTSDVEEETVSILSPSQRAYARTGLFLDDGSVLQSIPAMNDDALAGAASMLGFVPDGHNGSQNYAVDVQHFAPADRTRCTLYLDGVYRAISTGETIIVQDGSKYSAHLVMGTLETPATIKLDEEGTPGPSVPVTRLTLLPEIDPKVAETLATSRLVIHYNLHDIGRLTRVALTELTADDILDKPLDLEGLHDRPPPGQSPTEFILEDANGRGVLVKADLSIQDDGRARLTVKEGEWTGGLRVPVKAYGNVVRISRGETVRGEVLGNGDPGQAFQTFQLKKSPLTYLPAEGAERGIKSTLEVRVDGVLWHERRSFYGAGPLDPVYIVRHDDDQNTFITFGDGTRGMRLPSGIGNVRATYRWGAGADSPPPGAINQIVRGVPGLLRVRSPIPVYGGADAETADQIRKRAPASALILGRCVSLADFAARVACLPGVRNSKVEFGWDATLMSGAIQAWYLPNADGADLSKLIVSDLQALSEPGTLIRARPALPLHAQIAIGITVHPDRLLGDVEAAVRAALLDPGTGMLAPENTPIGGPLSRSALIAAIRAIPGVLDVTSLRYSKVLGNVVLVLNKLDTFPGPGLKLGAGQYLDFAGTRANNLVVHAHHPEQRGCIELGT